MKTPARQLNIPLSSGIALIPIGGTEDDYELLLATLELWKRRIAPSEPELDFEI